MDQELTIPMLRKAFEHIDEFVKAHISDPDFVDKLKREWERTFYKEISTDEIKEYLQLLEGDIEEMKLRNSRKKQSGGSAPIDWTTRAGVYIVPGGVNGNSYAQVPKYVESGFWNPEPGRSYDPVPGQTRFPTSVPAGMGSNLVQKGGGCGCGSGGDTGVLGGLFKGGRRRTRGRGRGHSRGKGRKRKYSRRLHHRGGGIFSTMSTALKQMAMNPVISTTPPNPLQDAKTAWQGKPLGQSPDPTQTKLDYQSSSSRFNTVSGTVSPINVNMKHVIDVN